MRNPQRDDETTVLPGTGVSSPFGAGGAGATFPDFSAAPGAAGAGRGGGSGTFGSGHLPHSDAEPTISAETIVARVRRHGRHLTFPVLVLLAVAGASGYFVGALPELWMNIAAAAGGVLIAIVLGIAPILAWLARRVVVTTRRVIVHHGFFVRHRSEVSLARVREVRSKQNPVQRLWGSGDIDLLVGTESTRIPDAPSLKTLHAAIQELSERSYDEQVRATGYGF